MEIRVNETAPASMVNQTGNTQPVDDSFKFTLSSAIEDQDLQNKVTQMLNDITLQGKLIAKHIDIREMKN